MNRNTVSVVAGTRISGHQDGEGNVAKFNQPFGVAVDKDGNIIVADAQNNRIRKITPQAQVSTLAGTGKQGYRDGEGTVAQFYLPCGVAVDGDGNVIVGDTMNNCIRKITPQGHVSTLAGTGERGHQDGEANAAQFYRPQGVAVDGGGNVIVGVTRVTIVSARSHHRAKCPLWRALARRAIETEKGTLLNSSGPEESRWMGVATSL